MTPEEISKLDRIHDAVIGMKPIVIDSSERIKGMEYKLGISENEIARHDEKLNSHEFRIKKTEDNIDGLGSVFREHERDSRLHSHSTEDTGVFLKAWILFLNNWKIIALSATFAVSILNIFISLLHRIPMIPATHIGGVQ